MSNELVTFGRVPKDQIPETKTPGKLWVTNDTNDNPDNLSEAFVDDSPTRRLQITDKDLRNRVSHLEDIDGNTDPISDNDIEQIIREAGSNPASPLNFKNNMMFCDSRIDDSDAEQGEATIALNPYISLPNLETPYNLLVVTYPNNFPYGNYNIRSLKLRINESITIDIDSNDIKGIKLNFLSGNNFPWHCFTKGTYVFRLSVTSGVDSISLNSLYVFPERPLIMDNIGLGFLQDQNLDSLNPSGLLSSIEGTQTYTSIFNFNDEADRLDYNILPNALYFRATTKQISLLPNPHIHEGIDYGGWSFTYNLTSTSQITETMKNIVSKLPTKTNQGGTFDNNEKLAKMYVIADSSDDLNNWCKDAALIISGNSNENNPYFRARLYMPNALSSLNNIKSMRFVLPLVQSNI